MNYKIVDENGNDIIERLNYHLDMQDKIVDKNATCIENLRETLNDQRDMIHSLSETIIKLQEQMISIQNTTLMDVVKNTFVKKSNLKKTTIEIE